MAIQVFKNKPKKLPSCHGNIQEGWLVELNFPNGKYINENSQSRNSKLQAVLKMFCDLGEGAQSAPLAWIGIKTIDRKSFGRGNFLVLRPVLLKNACFNSVNR